MTTAASLVADIQLKLGDPSGNRLGSALVYTWLDQAQKEFITKTMPLRQKNGATVATSQERFTMPTDCIMVEALISKRGWPRKVAHVNPTDFINQQSAVENAVHTDPTIWTEQDGAIYVYPPYADGSKTTTLNATTSSTTTTLTLASTDNLRSRGRVRIGSEDVEYTGKATTTLTGCTRAVGRTTAATYVSAATVTQIDLDILYRRHATAMASSDSPEIRAIWHEKLELYVQYLALIQEGSFDKAKMTYELWLQAIEDAKYAIMRESLGPLSVRDTETQLINGLYGPL